MLATPLQEIMTQGYLYVEEHQPTGKALDVMRDMNISCVYVLRNTVPTGIVTERSILLKGLEDLDLAASPVASVMTRPLLTLTPEHSVAEACGFMLEHSIRHLGILDGDGNLKGTVTTANIVSMLQPENLPPSVTVSEIMESEVAQTTPSSSLHEAAFSIARNRSCCALAMEGDTPVGVVSEKDICRCIGYGQDIHAMKVSRVMSSPVIGVPGGSTIAEAISTLRHHHIHRVVVTTETGSIAGILALNSIVRHVRKIVG